jgi:hypothetical protein
MTVYHHRSADHIAKHVLQKWRGGHWLNDFISPSITLAQSPADFPSPDSDFQDVVKKTRISFEFKPYTETKRGMMTGLGQAIAYLRKANASYLVSPSRIDQSFDMEGFLKSTFDTFIKGRLPVGLIIYDGEELANIRIGCDIQSSLDMQQRELALTDEPYWCWWRDTSPDLILKLGFSAEQITIPDNRSKLVWNYFWDNYFATPQTRISLNNVESNIFNFDMTTKMIPFETLKRNLRQQIQLGQISTEDAINLLKIKGWGQGYTENNYQNYKKNFTITMDHINFWDENKQLTPLGKKFVQRNKFNLDNLVDEFAQIMLVEGKHENLISDIENISKNLDEIADQDEYLKDIHDHLDRLGYISKNPNRRTTGSRKFLQAEKQLWGHFSLLRKNGNSYFHPGLGFVFDHQRINYLVDLFYRNYSDVSTFIDPPEISNISFNR